MRVLADEIKINSADEGTTVQLVVYTPPSTRAPTFNQNNIFLS